MTLLLVPTIPEGTPTTMLLEPSFVDLISAIEQAKDLSEQTRRHWTCSLRQAAKWLNRPAGVIPARWRALRISMAQLHHARVGVTSKTLANHKSNVRAALHWFNKASNIPQRGVRLSTDWAEFREAVHKYGWGRVSSLVRYCSARGLGRSDVNDEVFGRYWDYRAETTGLATHNTAKRFMVRAWNTAADTTDGRALHRLTEPSLKMAEPAWEAFAAGLRQGIDLLFLQASPRSTALLAVSVFSRAARDHCDPAGRACRDGPDGGSDWRAHRAAQFVGSTSSPRCRRKGA